MLDLEFIRQNSQKVKQNAKNKGVDINVKAVLKLDQKNKELLTKIGNLRAELNLASKSKPDKKTIKELRKKSEEIKRLEEKRQTTAEKLNQEMLQIPAMVRTDVKIGRDESENEIIRKVGKIPEFNFKIKDNLQLAEDLDLIDIQRAAKVSGSRFGYLKNELVMLELAIIRYVFDLIVFKEKFTPLLPPVLISEKAMRAMGYLEHGGEEETYHFQKDNLYLVGTSEQSVGPYHLDEIFNENELPLHYCAFSTCFRREAGASGKDTRGILRVHQFDKVEMFVFCKPEDSDDEHEYLLSLQEQLVSGLRLPYQVVKLCSGDLAKPSARTYDIETWMPSQNTYRETHSTSNCIDFQARRLNVRYKDKSTGKNEFVHTLNGTAFALGRILISILENYQQADGTVLIPKVLQPFLGGMEKIEEKK